MRVYRCQNDRQNWSLFLTFGLDNDIFKQFRATCAIGTINCDLFNLFIFYALMLLFYKIENFNTIVDKSKNICAKIWVSFSVGASIFEEYFQPSQKQILVLSKFLSISYYTHL